MLAVLTVMLLVTTGCSSRTPDSDQSISGDADSALTTTPDTTTPDTTPPAASGESEPSIEPLRGEYTVEVIAILAHDPQAYTQGLEWHDGWLYESTGQYGASDRRRLDPSTGDVELLVSLDVSTFGEGLTVLGDEILQLSWREGELLRSGVDDLELRSTQRYEGEGWGLCHDGDALVMSDGSSTLTRRDAATFEVLSTLEVTADGEPLDRLNELECVGDQILANIYGLDQLVAIDSTTGEVVAVIDAAALRPDGLSADDFDYVLNGVAHQPETDHWYLTGKYWPVLYEVALIAD